MPEEVKPVTCVRPIDCVKLTDKQKIVAYLAIEKINGELLKKHAFGTGLPTSINSPIVNDVLLSKVVAKMYTDWKCVFIDHPNGPYFEFTEK
jgi:hypothetical protein